ncbi:MAG: protein kinase [Phycisphaeraceae bacterium]|nr:protein kinase [Phycisphaeraceae bacterium]
MDAHACNSVDYIRVRDAFLRARAGDRSQRETLLSELESAEPEVASAVRSMLALADEESEHHPSPDGAPGEASLAGLVTEALGSERSGVASHHGDASVGAWPEVDDRYRIIRRISRGSSTEVFLAEQLQPVRRVVAIKCFADAWLEAESDRSSGSPHDPSRASVALRLHQRRFEQEARVLAMLDHPGIARITDAGVTRDGRRFLAMEFIEGMPIDRACEVLHLDARARIEKILDVCGAVEHAHGRGVIHRDLKPSNVLLSMPDGKVKVIDFGIARLLEREPGSETRLTLEGQVFGTLAYMSPEQLAGQSAGVRSDVYALGVILHEVLTGRRLAIGRQLMQGRRSDHVDLSSGVAAHLRRQRDLEAIIDCAAAPLEADRYPSAAALADDLRRLLDDRPIVARPARLPERLLLSARRAPVTAVLILIAVLASMSAVAAVVISRDSLSRQIESQRDEIALILDGVIDALHPVIGTSAARRSLAESLLVRTEALLRIDPEDLQLRMARARLIEELGNVAMESADLDRARTLRAQALHEFTIMARERPGHPALRRREAQAIVLMGDVVHEEGRIDEAFVQYEAALNLLRVLHKAHPEDVGILDDLTWALDRVWPTPKVRADPEVALTSMHERLRIAEELVERTPDRSLSHYTLLEGHRRIAMTMSDLGRHADATRHFDQAIAVGTALVAREPRRFHYRAQLGHTLYLAARGSIATNDLDAAWQHLLAADRVSASLLAMEPDRIEAIVLRLSERKDRAIWHRNRGETEAYRACRMEIGELSRQLEQLQGGPTEATRDLRRTGWLDGEDAP